MALDFAGNLFDNELIDDSGARLSDWKAIIDSGTRKLFSDSANNETKTTYTVPAGKVFYPVSAFILLNNASSGRAQGILLFNDIRVMALENEGADPKSMTEGISWPLPIKLFAGETIKLESNAVSAFASMTVQGYEING